MKFCPECGARLTNENTKFCPECGVKLNATEAPKVEETPISSKPIDPLMEEYEYEVLPDGTYAIIRPKDVYCDEFIVPEGVSVIKARAFNVVNTLTERLFLKKIELPRSLKIIENRAFFGAKITSISFPCELMEIGENAFEGCEFLREVNLPNSVKKIGSNAFYGCKTLKRLTISKGMTVIPQNAFAKTSIQDILIPGNIKKIESGAFDISGKKSLTIEEGVVTIERYAFGEIFASQIITIPNSVRNIGETFIRGRVNAVKVILGDGIKRCSDCRMNKTTMYSVAYGYDMKSVDENNEVEGPYGLNAIDKKNIFVRSKDCKPIHKMTDEEKENLFLREDAIERKKVKAQGRVLIGNTDSSKLKLEKVGDITFYIEERKKGHYDDPKAGNLHLVGLSCEHPIDTIEFPSIKLKQIHLEDLGAFGINTIILPRDMKRLVYNPTRLDLWVLGCKVKTVIIPKETDYVEIHYGFFDSYEQLLFENTKCWGGRAKEILTKPKELPDILRKNGKIILQKNLLSKLFSK